MADRSLAFLLAPGAGASSTHPRMQAFSRLLGEIGRVVAFDYPYRLEGRKAPDPLPKLIAAHRAALAALRAEHDGPIVLAGKSMGGRVGCHVALVDPIEAVVCLGYPLCGAGDRTKLRDQVLIDLRAPVAFVQGTRDPLCPLDLLADVRGRMTARSALAVVEGGDHSLVVAKGALRARGATQGDVDREWLNAVAGFLAQPTAARAERAPPI